MKTENEIVQGPSVLDHFGSLVTGATIGFAGASAFVKEGIQAGGKGKSWRNYSSRISCSYWFKQSRQGHKRSSK
ncbi:MAG: hypothetical protein HYR79_04450 [Nitrospirae bacterium]|nr:hypothetical protein [Nitrospirota bacterium]